MQQEMTDYRELLQGMRSSASPAAEPSADLWSRIQAAHAIRLRRDRQRKLGAITCIVVAAVTAGVLMSGWNTRPLPTAADIDWQARAQALELQLHTLAAAAPGADENVVAQDAESDLVRVDRALQAAYDNAADKEELVPLWKQRSELLSALVTARRQGLAISRI